MENPFKLHSIEPQESEVEPLVDIIEFIKKHDLTSGEITVAYEIALGIDQEIDPENPIREEVYVLARKIDQHTVDGLTLNRIQELITTKEDYELAIEKYFSMVDSMLLTDNEKRTLKSIIEKERKGILTIVDTKTQKEITEIVIPPENLQELNKNLIALYLIGNLNNYIGRNIEIIFIG